MFYLKPLTQKGDDNQYIPKILSNQGISFPKCIFIFTFLSACFSFFDSEAQKQLNITPGGYLVLNGNVALVTNNAAINNNGTIGPGSSTFYFTGNSDTTLSYITGTSTTTCTNLTVNKSTYGVAIKSPVHVTNVLTMSAGNLYPDSNLTLISNAANTARVAPVPPSCNIIGKTFVERYFPARRAWRLITAPVTVSNTIYQTWQNGGIYTIGQGMFVTGKNPTEASGLDASPENNYSMETFNPSNQSLNYVTNSNINISPGNSGSADNIGYFTFVRGDRNLDNVIIPNCDTTTLTCLGDLQTGDQIFNAATSAGSYTLIGNPYASPIDFNNVNRTNLIKRFIVWDPTLNSLGAYVTLDDIDNTGVYSTSVAGTVQTNEIQSGQAFFVQTLNAGAASITISESSKSSTNNTLIFRPANTTISFITSLYLLNTDNSTILADGALAEFNNQFDSVVNWQDAVKNYNINETIGLVRDGINLAIERDPIITTTDTLFLNLTGQTARSYQFQFTGTNMNGQGITGILKDSYLGTSTPINLDGTVNKINFSVIAGNSASAAPNRFIIVFRPSSVLPVTFTSVNAYQENTGINVEWNVANELNIVQYEVQRSTDGIHFTNENPTKATGNNQSSINYNWLDTNPLEGANYYRIESIGTDGNIQFSQVVKVVINIPGSNISVYPNPVVGQLINLKFNNKSIGDYQFNLINADGQTVYNKEIYIVSSNSTETLIIPTALAKGIYELKIIKTGEAATVKKITIQ
jgi:hypothetical protein